MGDAALALTERRERVAEVLFTLASLASIVTGTVLFKLFAPKGSLWIGNCSG